MENVTDIAFFILCNIYFLLVLVLDLKGIINKLKRYYVTMERADVVAFTFAMWQIRPCLLCQLIWPEATVMTLFAVLRVSPVG